MKRYIIRALKYFVYLSVILFAIITVLVAFGLVEKNIDSMFVNGKDSLWQIALIIAAFSAGYPSSGYSRRELTVLGEPSGVEAEIVRYMKGRKYDLTSRSAGTMVFRKTNSLVRTVKMCEDAISFERVLQGYILEGRTKDIVRIESGLSSLLSDTSGN
ncbi:MAG: hypothetical protein MJY43_00995 [Bacteroidales bacterium]|nr:hypothetical protein [Bacteroidales bacterium]